MHTPRKMWALPCAGVLLVVLVVLTPVAAVAASGTATIDGISRGTTSPVVPVTGFCTPTNGHTTAALFLRGPGPSTGAVFSGPAAVDAFGDFKGSVTVPTNATAGSTYNVSAQCTDQGQAAGPESAGISLPPPGQAFMSVDQRGPPGPPASTTTVPSMRTTSQTPQSGPTGTTSGRATPIARQPQFTG